VYKISFKKNFTHRPHRLATPPERTHTHQLAKTQFYFFSTFVCSKKVSDCLLMLRGAPKSEGLPARCQAATAASLPLLHASASRRRKRCSHCSARCSSSSLRLSRSSKAAVKQQSAFLQLLELSKRNCATRQGPVPLASELAPSFIPSSNLRSATNSISKILRTFVYYILVVCACLTARLCKVNDKQTLRCTITMIYIIITFGTLDIFSTVFILGVHGAHSR
jgi:hypothetical protein